jgi:quinol monooxygenase YgiN
MYGLIGKMSTVAGKRDEMIAILKESAAAMPGCLSYVVAKDAADENALWVTEVWDSKASHDASLSLPRVRETIGKARSMIAGMQRIAETEPVLGVK